MNGLPTIFGDGVTDVHVANGVARITLGAATGQNEGKPVPTGLLVIPVLQLPALARVLAEVTKQVEAKAREAMAAAAVKAAGGKAPEAPEAPPAPDQISGAFRFNG
jgi:hypothetical protein